MGGSRLKNLLFVFKSPEGTTILGLMRLSEKDGEVRARILIQSEEKEIKGPSLTFVFRSFWRWFHQAFATLQFMYVISTNQNKL